MISRLKFYIFFLISAKETKTTLTRSFVASSWFLVYYLQKLDIPIMHFGEN